MQIVQNAAREGCACKGREEIRSQNACNARDTALGLPSLVDWTGLLEAQEGEIITHSQNAQHQQVCGSTFSKREKRERAWPCLGNFSTRFEIPSHSTLQRVPRSWLSSGQRGQPTASLPAFPIRAFTVSPQISFLPDDLNWFTHTSNRVPQERSAVTKSEQGKGADICLLKTAWCRISRAGHVAPATTKSHASWLGTGHRQKRAICKNWEQRKLYTYI